LAPIELCDFSTVINTDLHIISHRFWVIANYLSNFRVRQGWHTR